MSYIHIQRVGSVRRLLKACLAAFCLWAVPLGALAEGPTDMTSIEVHKSATCGCCNKWIEHLHGAGYAVVAHDTDKMSAYKMSVGVPAELQSCHTATVEGYVIEGHVPAREIERLLRERPEAVGLSVPGMVSGSPGMENGIVEKYDVILFKADGTSEIYASY